MRLLDRILKNNSDFEVVTDLDAILTRTVGFKFKGRVHKIPPLELTTFLLATNAMAKMDILRQKNAISAPELIDAYEELFGIVCPSITRSDIKEMSHQQVASLFNMIYELIIGKADLEVQKKKSLESGAAAVSQ